LPKFGELIPLQPMLDEHELPLPFILLAYAPDETIGAEIMVVRVAKDIEVNKAKEIHLISDFS
jgi:hypothetical protein